MASRTSLLNAYATWTLILHWPCLVMFWRGWRGPVKKSRGVKPETARDDLQKSLNIFSFAHASYRPRAHAHAPMGNKLHLLYLTRLGPTDQVTTITCKPLVTWERPTVCTHTASNSIYPVYCWAGIERLAYRIRCMKHRANESAFDSESRDQDSNNHSGLRLMPLFNDLDKWQPHLSDEETERTLARLKEDIMTVFSTYTGKKMRMNITAEERWALKELKTNTTLIVKPSDKCKRFVIMDREMYVDKVRSILDDPDVYEKLRRDPTRQVEEITQLWRRTTDNKTTIPSRLLYALVPRHSWCAEWYGLPKDHKPQIPLRPIVSACNTPCERVSWLLERILH